MKNLIDFSEEQLDYLREMMNIGTGNAATALSQILHETVDTTVPEIRICPLNDIPAVIGEPTLPTAGVMMEMTGDIEGYLFFIVPESQRQHFTELVRRRETAKSAETGLALIIAVASAVAASHLKAIDDFCGLNVHHSPPRLAVDMVQAVLDEAIARVANRMPQAILIRSEFHIVGERISTILLMIPDRESASRMVASVQIAGKRLGRA